MKKLRISILATVTTVVLLLSLSLMGCTSTAISGSGNLITEQHDYTDFTEVEIDSAFEYTITKAATFSIAITADDNIMQHVNVSKVGSRVKARMGNVSLRNVHYEATITMPALSALSINSASRGSVNGFDSTAALSLTVSGASRLNMDDMTAGAVTADVSSASNVTGTLNASSLDLNDSGASTVQIEGEATGADLNVSGASKALLIGFQIVNADVTVSGASKATVNATGTLDINAGSASTVQYMGEATLGTVNVSGASTVSAL
ncbi:GIN domain-containing protein [Chloroflexota bacterium]